MSVLGSEKKYLVGEQFGEQDDERFGLSFG